MKAVTHDRYIPFVSTMGHHGTRAVDRGNRPHKQNLALKMDHPTYRRSNRTARVGNRAPEQHQLALRPERPTTTAAPRTDGEVSDSHSGNAHQSENS